MARLARNPQTLVWRSNANQRQPQLDSLEAISRMTYFDMVNQVLMLRQSPEEITINECLKALTSQARPRRSPGAGKRGSALRWQGTQGAVIDPAIRSMSQPCR